MALRLEAQICSRQLKEPFVISRGAITSCSTLYVRLSRADGAVGHGEAHGVDYAGETPERMLIAVETARPRIEAGLSRDALLSLLPAGGARFAVDSALWDLESKSGAGDPFERCGLPKTPVASVVTIGIQPLAGYETAAREAQGAACLKVKVGDIDPAAAIEAIRRGAPDVPLIVDPNQAWSVPDLKVLAPALAKLGVVLLEQPIPVGAESQLDGYTSPIPLCADEALNDAADLPKLAGRFSAINIKLDKVGGLTAALRLADAAEELGFRLMVGTMVGPSLGVAPAMVLAQRCAFADLDGPPLLVEDNPHGFAFEAGRVARPYDPRLWG